MPASLLATKIMLPPVSAGWVQRPQLFRRLDAGLKHTLTLVSAPAGYGKTSLLSGWATSVGRSGSPTPVAWFALDRGDNDLTRFWGHLLMALNRLPGLTGAAAEALAMLQAVPAVALETAITSLINALAERETLPDFAIVLDDYHLITALPIHDTLAFLLDHLPPQLHIFLASRADPPLPLARLRARGQLQELRAHDLRFSFAEVAAFLNQVKGLGLSPSAVAELETRTEGWVTGLQLAALVLQAPLAFQAPRPPDRPAEPVSVVQAFTGQHPFVLDYLVEEVLRHQPAAVRQFLEGTAILERLCGPLCEAVTGQPEGSAMLAQLWRANLFIEPLDEVGQWYRRHHLLAEVLLKRLQETQPALIPQLHKRARDWYAQHGYWSEALRHTLAGGDLAWAADLVERDYRTLIARGELVTLRHWLDLLPPELVRSRPQLQLCWAWAWSYSGRSDVLEQHLAQAEAALATQPDEAAAALRGELLALRANMLVLRGHPDHVVELAQQALNLIPTQDALLRALASQALGNALRLQGQPLAAQPAFEAALAIGTTASPLVLLAALLRLGQVQAMQGQLRAAAQTFQRSLQAADHVGGQALLYSAEAHVRLGDIYREWGERALALEHVVKGIELAERADNVIAILSGRFTLAHLRAARGETDLAREALQQAEALAGRYDFPHMAERVASHKAWLELRFGELSFAAAWADGYASQRSQRQTLNVSDLQDTLLARVRLRQRRFPEAQVVLTGMVREAEAAGRGQTVFQAKALQALVWLAEGRSAEALEVFTHICALAAPDGYYQMYLDEGEPMRLLLARFVEQLPEGAVRTYVTQLSGGFGSSTLSQQPARLTPSPLVEPLSPRELEVLCLMAEGQSNQAVAEALVISVGTVKSHINRILGKLAARNRTEAVAHARACGLL